jgi:hypothetical protein
MTTARTKAALLAAVAILAAAIAYAVIHAHSESLTIVVPTGTVRAVAAGHHYGWQHNPHNPHYVTPPVPQPTCDGTWIIGNAIGDVPHCVPS